MNLQIASDQFASLKGPFLRAVWGCLSFAAVVGSLSIALGATTNVAVVGFAYN